MLSSFYRHVGAPRAGTTSIRSRSIATSSITKNAPIPKLHLIPGGGSFTSGMPHRKGDREEYRAFLLDMDGVLHRKGTPVPGADEFLAFIKQRGIPRMVLTNECRYTNDQISARLRRILGEAAHLEPSEIYTAANSTRDFFKRLFRHNFDGSCYVIGEEGLLQNVEDVYRKYDTDGRMYFGNEPIRAAASKVEYVVVGSVFQDDTRSIERAAEFVRNGAKILYTCPDYVEVDQNEKICFGMPMPVVTLLEKVLGCKSYNLGKPNPHMIRMAQHRLLKGTGLDWKDVLFVGDSMDTDIRTSIENGIDCALVLSGTTQQEDLPKFPLQPNYVFESVLELKQELENHSPIFENPSAPPASNVK